MPRTLARTPTDVFRALGDEHRLKILDFLAHGDPGCCRTEGGICGCDVQDVIGLAQATVSHHMKILVEAGLVAAQKRGRWVYYSLNREGLELARQGLDGYLEQLPTPPQHVAL